MSSQDLSQHSMLDLFRLEAESQVQVLTSGLLALERDHAAADQLEACMRAAHSLKGAARIVDLPVAVRVAHAMEDCFVAAQEGRLVLGREGIDVLLRATDLIGRIAGVGDLCVGAGASGGERRRGVPRRGWLACSKAAAQADAPPSPDPRTPGNTGTCGCGAGQSRTRLARDGRASQQAARSDG